MGFGWFWHGPNLKTPFDVVDATRTHWGAKELSKEETEQMRGLFISLESDPKSDKEKVRAFEQFLNELYPQGVVTRPSVMPADLVKLADDLKIQMALLAIADRAQVIDWLRVKNNFDRTFPDKQKLTHEKQLKLLDQWEEEWKREWTRLPLRDFARVKYSYLALEVLSLTLVAGAIIALSGAFTRLGSSSDGPANVPD